MVIRGLVALRVDREASQNQARDDLQLRRRSETAQPHYRYRHRPGETDQTHDRNRPD